MPEVRASHPRVGERPVAAGSHCGKCSACRSKISRKYPLVEALAGLGAAYAAWRFGATATALGAVLFIWFTIALAFIDQEPAATTP
jgi:prepilin signal peptidase PulO-like enzyme (type II secretory pathway)